MRILILHNLYKQAGGEDAVFRAERGLLRRYGHEVDEILFDNADIKTFYDTWITGLKLIYNPDSTRSISDKINSFEPDIIHVHNFLPLMSPSVFFVARKRKIPVVLTLHNYRLICPSATLYFDGQIYEKSIHSIFPFDAIWKGVYRNSRIQTAAVALMTLIHSILGTWRNRVDAYITLTQFAKKKILNSTLDIPKNKLMVKANFSDDYGEGAIKRKNYFLFVGRLTGEKGIETLLTAANLHNFKLVIIGDGPLKGLVENACLLNPNISYVGFQSKLSVIHYLKACKALIFPSIWYEGFPVTIAEAFSTGTPVIASNIGSMSEIIQHEQNGLHFKAGDEKDLVAKIVQLEEDEELRRKLSSHARECYRCSFSPEHNYDQLIHIYKKVIGNNSRQLDLEEFEYTGKNLLRAGSHH